MSSQQRIFVIAVALIAAASIIVITYVGLGRTKTTLLGLQNLPLSLPGFEPFPTPRNFDGPGTVIRVTPTGSMQYVTTLEIKVEDAGPETIPKANGTQNWGVEAGASGFWRELTVGLEGASSSTYSLEVIGARRYRVESESKLDAVLDDVELNWSRPGRLFVIRETIASKGIRVEFFDEVSGEVEADFTDLVSGKNFAVSSNSASLSVDFEGLANVFFSADELSKPKGLVSSEVQRLREVPPPVWSTEDRNNETIIVVSPN